MQCDKSIITLWQKGGSDQLCLNGEWKVHGDYWAGVGGLGEQQVQAYCTEVSNKMLQFHRIMVCKGGTMEGQAILGPGRALAVLLVVWISACG